MITVEEVQAMQARAEKVTPGPWGSPTANIGRVIAWFEQEQPDGTKRWQPLVGIVEGDAEHFWFGKDDIRYPQTDEGSAQRCADIGFICSARTDLPRLAADWTRLRAIVDRLPQTADGIACLPGDPVWFGSCEMEVVTQRRGFGKTWDKSDGIAAIGDGELPYAVAIYSYYENDTGYGEQFVALVSECYSTEAAALAASASPKSGGGVG